MRAIVVLLLLLSVLKGYGQNISGVINTYTPVSAISNAPCGEDIVTVASSAGFAIGDRVMIIQMKGAAIDLSNTSAYGSVTSINDAGNYELNYIQSITGNSITLQYLLLNTYTISGDVQLIKVPQYTNATVTGTLTAQPWNGSTGGVLAFEVSGTLTLNANIDVSDKGFRAGQPSINFYNGVCTFTGYFFNQSSGSGGQKGEGISVAAVVAAQSTDWGRGALANGGGGGNHVNAGGAGGGNYGAGGQGGDEWVNCSGPVGGLGGISLSTFYSNANNKIFMGGGGGGGHQNDGTNAGKPGVNGSGIIIIKAGTIIGNGNSINANGTDNNIIAGNDGGGGGGAGGTILLDVNNYTGALNLTAKGGKGGDNNNSTFTAHSPGGGGGGGLIWSSAALPVNVSTTLTGGIAGVLLAASGNTWGAQPGQPGGLLQGLVLPEGTITPSIINVSIASQTNVSCNGGNDGSATAAASGGNGTYSYAWLPTGGNSSTGSNLSAGTYTVTVTDGNGCTATQTVNITEPPALTASIVSSTPATCGNFDGSATANASGGTGVYTFSWFPSGGSAAAASNLAGGTYTVTVTDGNSCTATAPVTITASAGLTLNVSSADVSCNGGNDGSATVSAAGGSGQYTYSWQPSGGNNSSAGNLTAGTYTVTVNDTNNCISTATVLITDPSPVVLAQPANDTICIGQSITLTASVSGGAAPYSLSWSPQGPVVSPSVTASYTVTATDANGCLSAPGTMTVVVNLPLNVTAGAGATICPSGTAVITASAAGGDGNYFYTWLPGNMTGNLVNVNPAATTTYSVIVTDGCSTPGHTDVVTVSVAPLPSISFTLDDPSGCYPHCVTFTDNSTISAGSITAWQWDFGDNSAGSTQQDTSHCFNSAGTYNVTLTATSNYGCSSALTNNSMVTVSGYPDAQFTFEPTQVTIISPEIFFHDSSIDAVQWSWSFGDVLSSSSSQQNPSFTYPDTGCYNVQLIVSNSFGCNDTVDKDVCIDEEFAVYVPNAFTPNGDGVNDYFFPIGSGFLTGSFDMLIFDRWGNLIYETDNANAPWDGKVKGRPVQLDVYVWKIYMEDHQGRKHNLIGRVSVIR